MKIKLKDKEFLILLAGGAVVLLVTLVLTNQTFKILNSEQKHQEEIEEQKIVIEEREETEGWSLYTHEDLRFSIRYPESIVLWRETPEDAIFTYQEYAKVRSLGGMPVLLQIVSRDNLENSVIKALENETPVGVEPKDYRHVQINNALGIQPLEGSGFPNNYYLNDMDKEGPVVRIHAGSGIPEVDVSVLEIMISTFMFER